MADDYVFESIDRIEIVDREKDMPNLLMLKIPISGYTKRRFIAKAVLKNKTKINLQHITWSLHPKVQGISIDKEGLLIIEPEAEAATFSVVAKYTKDRGIFGMTKVKTFHTSGKDTPPNPLEKAGWKLYFNDDFDSGILNRSVWVNQYLRNWSDDVQSKTNYIFEDSVIIIRADTDSKQWSPFDRNENSSITSFEKTYLHRFGENKNEFSRIIPEYDGLATKYGYFEIRAKLPDTGDGSHVAWWMIGVQDDQNINPQIDDPTVTDVRSSNETGEVDIIEIGLNDLTSWRPVIHANGSTCLEYLHVPETKLKFDPGNEFHIYGYEWDENGTKFYVDNQLVKATNRTFDYRMMTFLGLYPQGGMGKANKIFPKEFTIDYFRIYKKDEPVKANDIIFDKSEMPHSIEKPTGSIKKTFQLKAIVLDQFDKPLRDVPLFWQFSDFISGEKSKEIPGASIDKETGKITITNQVYKEADLFITSKVKSNPKVKKVFHVKVSDEPSRTQFVQIVPHNKLVEIEKPAGTRVIETKFTAKLMDQYGKTMDGNLRWQLAEGTTILDTLSSEGISIHPENGVLNVTSSVKDSRYIFVQAISDFQAKEKNGRYILDNTIYGQQLIKLVKGNE
ncbi:hypothetical protein QFZ31_003469 [Neobacillus niacini]|uniref:glycoside hydrolase family 16 protein n=1 Tax=Neobacillus driksii TaxID=3035913 RepID=UPI0027852BB2|nr:glycoside hydrolase family 16 protein [Neobacillus niacini]MDQ0973591.1 hypothetical protein [Neobacillus niacini]